MQVWYLKSVEGAGRLQQAEVEQPQAGPGQVLVKIRAASLNHRDLYIRQGVSSNPGGVSRWEIECCSCSFPAGGTALLARR